VPAVDHGDALGELVGFLEVLRGEQHRGALVDELADHVPELVAAREVEAGRRLVEEEHRGLRHERRRDVEAPAHAAGVRAQGAVGRIAEREAPQQLVGPGGDGRSRQLAEDAHHAQVLAPGEVRVDRGVLAGEADAPPHGVGLAHHVATEHLGAARVGVQDGGQHPNRRGLAGAVGPEQTEHRAFRHLEVDAVEGRQVAVALRQPLDHDRSVTHVGDPLTDS
jgi:hypothetical protein